MNDVEAETIHNIEQTLRNRQRHMTSRASVSIGGPECQFYARELALRGYKTALLMDGSGYRIYAKETT